MIAWLRRISLSKWILIAMVAGIILGWQFPHQAVQLNLLSTVFLHLIKCIIVPLLFSTLVVGIAGHTDDLKAVGRLALKSFIYFEIVTTLALFIGLGAVNLVQPGAGVQLTASASQGQDLAAKEVTFDSFFEHVVPTSLFDAAARNDVLQVVIYAIIFGIAVSRVKGKPRQVIL